MDTQTFLELLQQALDHVSDDYYGTQEKLDNAFLAVWDDENVQLSSSMRKSLERFLSRYDERVFCYELYHQIRMLMDKYYKEHPPQEGKTTICLQAELKKRHIGNVIKLLLRGIPLSKEYIPDFLLHSPRPGNFDYQLLIMEVKSDPNLSWSSIKSDLAKIQEFIAHYFYQQGVFLTVNTSPERMYAELIKLKNREWIRTELPDRSKILFMCKEQYGKDTRVWNLGDLSTA